MRSSGILVRPGDAPLTLRTAEPFLQSSIQRDSSNRNRRAETFCS